CAACLRGLRRGLRRLRARLFFLTKPWWQVIQGGLSVTDRSLELRKIYAPRSVSRSPSRVRGRFPNCLNDGAPPPPTMEPLSLMAGLPCVLSVSLGENIPGPRVLLKRPHEARRPLGPHRPPRHLGLPSSGRSQS